MPSGSPKSPKVSPKACVRQAYRASSARRSMHMGNGSANANRMLVHPHHTHTHSHSHRNSTRQSRRQQSARPCREKRCGALLLFVPSDGGLHETSLALYEYPMPCLPRVRFAGLQRRCPLSCDTGQIQNLRGTKELTIVEYYIDCATVHGNNDALVIMPKRQNKATAMWLNASLPVKQIPQSSS